MADTSPVAALRRTLIASWPRNGRETLRVALDTYNGRPTVDVRAWWRDEAGELRPGRSGITLSVAHLPALAKALNAALAAAISSGLVEAPAPAAPRPKDPTAAERQRRYRARRNGGKQRDVTASDCDTQHQEEFALTS